MGSCLSSADDRQRNPHSPMTPGGLLRGRKGSRKRHGSFGSSSFNSRNDLLAVHGRMYQNGASRLASMFTQQGKKGPNQDAMIIWENFGSKDDMVFCGVFDGHGPYGHLVARKVRDSLPSKLSAQWDVQTESDDLRNAAGSMNSEDTASICLDEERSYIDPEEREAPPEIFIKMRESFLRAFKVMDKELKVHPKIDCYCSGTTAVTILKQGQDLIIGNIGDSRAVLGTRDEDENLIAIQLTVDLKPNLPGEAERIRRCRGRVFALQDEPEVARVWLPNNNSPGLAMARAFGDFCLKDFGLISVPEVTYRHITDKDEFVVLATDGVWDVLSNSEVVEIVASAPTRSSAARTLVESAVRSWRYKYPTSKVDDCAVVCLFLNPDPSDSTTSSCCDTKELIDSSGPLADDDVHRDDPVPIGLDRSGTVRATSEILQEEPRGSPRQVSMVNSQKRLQSKAGGPESQDWSALEGVSRVNTLLTLPRFVQGGSDKQATESKRK